MKGRPSYAIRLAKEDFKFSAAHFTLLDGGGVEPLHGHNYRVRVELGGEQLGESGLLADVAVLKRRIREVCGRLDERTLVPARSERLELSERGADLEIRVAGRSYRIPTGEAALLPLRNVSVELLARLVWGEIAPALEGSAVDTLAVEVEETAGQSASYLAPLHAEA